MSEVFTSFVFSVWCHVYKNLFIKTNSSFSVSKITYEPAINRLLQYQWRMEVNRGVV